MPLVSLLAAWLLTAAPGPVPVPAVPPSGEEVIRAMHARYAGRWYRTLTFVQRTAWADGREQTWYESLQVPGLLRIDIAPLDSGTAILFRADSVYQLRGGKVTQAATQVHPLLLLGFDVYGLAPEVTIAKLRGLGFNLAAVHETTWQDRAVIVVGAATGDSTTAQFWIDKERLYFVRLIQPARQNPAVITEIQFNRYAPLGQGWIAPEVRFFADGRETLLEEYRDIRADPLLEPGLFVPEAVARPAWIR